MRCRENFYNLFAFNDSDDSQRYPLYRFSAWKLFNSDIFFIVYVAGILKSLLKRNNKKHEYLIYFYLYKTFPILHVVLMKKTGFESYENCTVHSMDQFLENLVAGKL